MILIGDVREKLKELPDQSVHCVVTSPPYWGLRDYGQDGQIGMENTPEQFVANMVEVFREVWRVLRDDGTLWLNLGDSYSGSGKGPAGNLGATHNERWLEHKHSAVVPNGLKPKDLVGIPWRVAFALQAEGWYLRQDIIWHKPNPMPESVTDRCTKSHEYIFLLSKSRQYYFDNEAIAEPITASTIARMSQPNINNQIGSDRVPGKTNGNMKAVVKTGIRFGGNKYGDSDDPKHATKSGNEYIETGTRNKRDVWTVTTKPYKGAHFATFPPDLITPCVLAGCPPDGTVLDPFFGAGTTGLVAQRHNRQWIGIELNPEYAAIATTRIEAETKPKGAT